MTCWYTSAGFYSILVRLKGSSTASRAIHIGKFLFHTGSIKSQQTWHCVSMPSLGQFLFHTGSIKSLECASRLRV